ncbi:hypothetical protein EU527_14145 [Candidatus Thorarchaeota archaeon]|nr:MAG: hypothetical protein EU527_14145 [Candidatus Thorarchaeota archaeon]
MEDKKQSLIQLVKEKNVSAIETLSKEIGLSGDQVISLIKELLEEGRLQGTLTSDEKRFFKSDIKISKAPVIERKDEEPSFLDYDIRPGLTISLIGFLILICAIAINTFLTIQNASDISAILIFVGLAILFIGLLLVARRKTPD